MDRVKHGDLQQLAILFTRYHVKLYNFFMKLTRDGSLSEDLVQNVFYRIIKYRQSFNSSAGRFISWMYRLARNSYVDHCKDHQKKSLQVRNLNSDQENIAAVADHDPEPAFKKLEDALLILTAEQRELILLNKFSGLKYEEIAAIYGKTTLSVRVQLHRAIKQLKKIYFNHLQEEQI